MATNSPGCLGFLFGARAQPTEPAEEPSSISGPLPYRVRDDFLSAAERSFFGVLQGITQGQYVVCPKVNLADVVFVTAREQNQSYWNRINRKHLDFVLCEPSTMRPLAAIELDDASHQRPSRQSRDDFVDDALDAAGLPLIRFSVRTAYSPSEIREKLQVAIAVPPADSSSEPTPPAGEPPTCPKCGIPMVLRTASRGTRAGESFYGCQNFPRCQERLTAH